MEERKPSARAGGSDSQAVQFWAAIKFWGSVIHEAFNGAKGVCELMGFIALLVVWFYFKFHNPNEEVTGVIQTIALWSFVAVFIVQVMVVPFRRVKALEEAMRALKEYRGFTASILNFKFSKKTREAFAEVSFCNATDFEMTILAVGFTAYRLPFRGRRNLYGAKIFALSDDRVVTPVTPRAKAIIRLRERIDSHSDEKGTVMGIAIDVLNHVNERSQVLVDVLYFHADGSVFSPGMPILLEPKSDSEIKERNEAFTREANYVIEFESKNWVPMTSPMPLSLTPDKGERPQLPT